MLHRRLGDSPIGQQILGHHFLTQQIAMPHQSASSSSADTIVTALTAALCPEHMKFKHKLAEEPTYQKSLIEVGTLCQQMILDNPEAYKEAELPAIDILPEFYIALNCAMVDQLNTTTPEDRLPATQNATPEEQNAAFKSAMKLFLLVGQNDEFRPMGGLHIKSDLVKNIVRVLGTATFLDAESLYLGLAVAASDEGSSMPRLGKGSDFPPHVLGSIVASGLAPWPTPMEMLNLANLQKQQQQQSPTTRTTASSSTDAAASASSPTTIFTEESLKAIDQLAEASSVPETGSHDKFLVQARTRYAQMLAQFGRLSPSDPSAQRQARYFTRARLVALVLIDQNVERETSQQLLTTAQGTFFRQWGQVVSRFPHHVRDDFAIDIIDCWSRLGPVYAASHPGVRPLDVMLDHLASTLKPDEETAAAIARAQEQKAAASAGGGGGAKPFPSSAGIPPSPSVEQIPGTPVTEDVGGAAAASSAASSTLPATTSKPETAPTEAAAANSGSTSASAADSATTTYESKYAFLRLVHNTVQHAAALFTSRPLSRTQGFNAAAQTNLVQKLTRIMTGRPSLVTCKIVKCFASLAAEDQHALRFTNDSAARLIRAIDAGLVHALTEVIKKLTANVDDVDTMDPRDLAPAISSLGLLGMCVVNTQGNTSANPAQFLLEDPAFPQTLLRMLSLKSLSQDGCSAKRAAGFVQACSASAVFVNHNIRDMVPALTERGFLKAVINSLKTTAPSDYHWCVVHAVPLLAAFSVHSCVKDFILENVETVVGIVGVLTRHQPLRHDARWSRDFFELLRTVPQLREPACTKIAQVVTDITNAATLRSSSAAAASSSASNANEEEESTAERLPPTTDEITNSFVLPFFSFASFLSGGLQSASHHGVMGVHMHHHHHRDLPPEIAMLSQRQIGTLIRNALRRLFDSCPFVKLIYVPNPNLNPAQQSSEQAVHRAYHADLASLLRSLDAAEFSTAWSAISSRVHDSIAAVRRRIPASPTTACSPPTAESGGVGTNAADDNDAESASKKSKATDGEEQADDDDNNNKSKASSSSSSPISAEDNQWLLFILEVCLSLREASGRGIDHVSQARERLMQLLIDVFFEVNATSADPVMPPAPRSAMIGRGGAGGGGIHMGGAGGGGSSSSSSSGSSFLDRVSQLLCPDNVELTPPRGGHDMLDFLQMRANRQGNDFANHSLRVIFDQLPRLMVDNNEAKLRQAQFCVRTAASILSNTSAGGPPSFLMSDDSLSKSLETLLELGDSSRSSSDAAASSSSATDDSCDAAILQQLKKQALRESATFCDILVYGFDALRSLSNFTRFIRSDRRKGCGRLVVKFFTNAHRDFYLRKCENLDRFVLELFSNLSRDTSSFEYGSGAAGPTPTRAHRFGMGAAGGPGGSAMMMMGGSGSGAGDDSDDEFRDLFGRPSPGSSIASNSVSRLRGSPPRGGPLGSGGVGGDSGLRSTPIAELIREGWSELQASIALEESGFDVDGAREWLAQHADLTAASDVSVQRRRRVAAAATEPETPLTIVRGHAVEWILAILRVGRERVYEKLESKGDSVTVWNDEIAKIHAPACRAMNNLTRLFHDRVHIIAQLVDALIENPWRNLDAVQQLASLFAQAGSVALRIQLVKETPLIQVVTALFNRRDADALEATKREQSALRETILSFLTIFSINGVTRRVEEHRACEYFMRGFCWNGQRCLLPHFEPGRRSVVTLDRTEMNFVRELGKTLSSRAGAAPFTEPPVTLSSSCVHDGVSLLSADLACPVLKTALQEVALLTSPASEEEKKGGEDRDDAPLLLASGEKVRRQHLEKLVLHALSILNPLAATSLSAVQKRIFEDPEIDLPSVFSKFSKLHLGERLGKFLKLMLEDFDSLTTRIIHSMKRAIDSILKDDESNEKQQQQPKFHSSLDEEYAKEVITNCLTAGKNNNNSSTRKHEDVPPPSPSSSSPSVSVVASPKTGGDPGTTSEDAASASASSDVVVVTEDMLKKHEVYKNVAVDVVEFMFEMEQARLQFPTLYETTFSKYCVVLKRDQTFRIALVSPTSGVTTTAPASSSSPKKLDVAKLGDDILTQFITPSSSSGSSSGSSSAVISHVPTYCSIVSHLIELPSCSANVAKHISPIVHQVLSLDNATIAAHMSAVMHLFTHLAARYAPKMCSELLSVAESGCAEGKYARVKRSCEILVLAASRQKTPDARLLHEIASKHVGRVLLRIVTAPPPSKDDATLTSSGVAEYVSAMESVLDLLSLHVTVHPTWASATSLEAASSSDKKTAAAAAATASGASGGGSQLQQQQQTSVDTPLGDGVIASSSSSSQHHVDPLAGLGSPMHTMDSAPSANNNNNEDDVVPSSGGGGGDGDDGGAPQAAASPLQLFNQGGNIDPAQLRHLVGEEHHPGDDEMTSENESGDDEDDDEEGNDDEDDDDDADQDDEAREQQAQQVGDAIADLSDIVQFFVNAEEMGLLQGGGGGGGGDADAAHFFFDSPHGGALQNIRMFQGGDGGRDAFTEELLHARIRSNLFRGRGGDVRDPSRMVATPPDSLLSDMLTISENRHGIMPLDRPRPTVSAADVAEAASATATGGTANAPVDEQLLALFGGGGPSASAVAPPGSSPVSIASSAPAPMRPHVQMFAETTPSLRVIAPSSSPTDSSVTASPHDSEATGNNAGGGGGVGFSLAARTAAYSTASTAGSTSPSSSALPPPSPTTSTTLEVSPIVSTTPLAVPAARSAAPQPTSADGAPSTTTASSAATAAPSSAPAAASSAPAPPPAAIPEGPLPWEGALDPLFLSELPSDMRREILRESFDIIRTTESHPVPPASNAAAPAAADSSTTETPQPPQQTSTTETSRVHPLFLAQVPIELQQEILQIERDVEESEANRRRQQEQQQQPAASSTAGSQQQQQQPAAGASGAAAPESPAEFLNSLPADLRADVLRTMDPAQLANDPALLAEANALRAPPPPPPPPPPTSVPPQTRSPFVGAGGSGGDSLPRLRHHVPGLGGLVLHPPGSAGSGGLLGSGGRSGGGGGGHDRAGFAHLIRQPRSRRDLNRRFGNGRSDPAPKIDELRAAKSPVLFVGKTTIGDDVPLSAVAKSVMPFIVLGRQVPQWLRKFFASLVQDPVGVVAVMRAICDTMSSPLSEAECALLHMTTPAHLTGGITVGAPKPVGVVVSILQLFYSLIKVHWTFRMMCVRLVNPQASFMHGPFHVANCSEKEPSSSDSKSGDGGNDDDGGDDGNDDDDADQQTECTPQEMEAAENNSMLMLLNAARPWLGEPDVQQALLQIFASLIQTVEKLKTPDRDANQDPFQDPPGYSNSVPYQHYRHQHTLRWRDPARADPRYQQGKAWCNVCALEYDSMGFQCSQCTYDLCPSCAVDDAPLWLQGKRERRFFEALFATSFPQTLLDLLALRCQDRLNDVVLEWIDRGVDATLAHGDSDAQWILDAQRTLVAASKEVVRAIDAALKTFKAEPAITKVTDMTITPEHASKALALLQIKAETSISTTLLPLLIIHAKRKAPQSIELRRMWLSIGAYLLEVERTLSACSARNSVVLPQSVVPLLIAFVQYHMQLYAPSPNNNNNSSMSNSINGGGGGPSSPGGASVNSFDNNNSPAAVTREISYSGAVHMERSETELLLGEANEVSQISENAIAKLNQTSPTRPKLPPMVHRFLEKNRVVTNACLHTNPSLLDGSLRFLTQAPRLVDFEFKQKEFRAKINQLRRNAEQLDLNVARSDVFAQSFNNIRARTPDQLRGQMHVRYRDEEGADAGGLTREWFVLIGEEIVNPNYALFVHSSEGTTFQPNPLSDINPDHLLFFRFVGRVLGLALLNDVPMDVHLTRAVYRHMAGIEPGLVDIATVDPGLSNTLQQILEMDLTENDLCLYFTITLQRFDSMEEVELIPGGADIPVTNENKKDYVRRRCRMRMTTLIEKQLTELCTGFYEIVPRHLITPFSEQELELLICGMPDVDVEDLRVHTEYQGYSASSPQIRWFWECVSGMSTQDKANLLQFATGCSKVPPGGFGNLAGMSGNRAMFSIMRVECDPELLPVAHTCFNRIDLPVYPSSEKLREKLMTAITYGSKGFALV